jgi:hypothetical protein
MSPLQVPSEHSIEHEEVEVEMESEDLPEIVESVSEEDPQPRKLLFGFNDDGSQYESCD